MVVVVVVVGVGVGVVVVVVVVVVAVVVVVVVVVVVAAVAVAVAVNFQHPAAFCLQPLAFQPSTPNSRQSSFRHSTAFSLPALRTEAFRPSMFLRSQSTKHGPSAAAKQRDARQPRQPRPAKERANAAA